MDLYREVQFLRCTNSSHLELCTICILAYQGLKRLNGYILGSIDCYKPFAEWVTFGKPSEHGRKAWSYQLITFIQKLKGKVKVLNWGCILRGEILLVI